jgi:L-alanine-DL-glutamate epimerase-like enolase superfamily enzyme
MSVSALDRRSFLALPALAATPLAAQFDANRTPKNLRIDAVDVVVTNPDVRPLGNYVLVKITTSEPGLYGWGDATCSGSEMAVATMLEEHLSPALIGRDPMRIGNLWQTLYHLPYYRSGSVHMSAMSGIDMALWDIKGKVAGLPVYELLGGKMRERLLTYRSAGGASIEEVEDGARALMERGYKVVKVQVAAPGAESGYAVPSSERVQAETQGAYERGVPPSQLWEPEPYVRILPKLFAHLRKTVGDQVGLLHDVHERVTPSQAIRLAKSLEEYDLFYLEDVLRPEHLDTYAIIRQQCSTPLAMGEIYTGAWEGRWMRSSGTCSVRDLHGRVGGPATDHRPPDRLRPPRHRPCRRDLDAAQGRRALRAVRHRDCVSRAGKYLAGLAHGALPRQLLGSEFRDPRIRSGLGGRNAGGLLGKPRFRRRIH